VALRQPSPLSDVNASSSPPPRSPRALPSRSTYPATARWSSAPISTC